MDQIAAQPHLDPEVRRQVFDTVTFEEALAVMRSRAGRPWNKAAAEIIIEGLRPADHDVDTEDALAHVKRVNRAN